MLIYVTSIHAFCFVCFSVEKYQNHFTWLKDAKFLAELENDSVDSDIIEEELHALQEEELPSGSVHGIRKGLIDGLIRKGLISL